MAQENLFKKIQELLGTLNGNFNVLEEQIDIDVQIEYFETSKGIKKTLDKDETMSISESLFSEEASLAQKRDLLVGLASIDKVEAYRILERYRDKPDPELREWALMAVQESRMRIEGSLLGQDQIFVSTGLGGRGRKLRYFVVFLVKEAVILTNFHQRIINSELLYTFKKHNVELEDIQFADTFVTIKALIPIELHISNLMDQALESCNEFGDFMQSNYILTNVRELSFSDVIELIEKIKNREIGHDDEDDEENEIDDEDFMGDDE
jgi:hypothetical protein